MKTVCKKLLCLMLVAMLLVSAVPSAFAAEGDYKFWFEVFVDDVPTMSGKYIEVAPNTSFTESEIKAHVKNFWPEYFGEGYEYVKITESTVADADNRGARVHVKTVEGCKHESTVKGTIAATCTAEGTEIERCDNPDCREIVSKKTLPKIGHSYSNGACSVCGAADPNAQQKNEVRVTIFETDTDGNAKQIGEEKVDVNAYASLDAMVKAIYGKNYKDYRYRDFGDGTAQLVVYALETTNGKNVYQLKVMHNDSTSNFTLIDIYEGEGILAAITNAGVAKKLKNMGKVVDDIEYKLVGFSLNHSGNSKTSVNVHHVAEASMADANGYIKVYADWEKKTDDNDDDFEFTDGTGGLYGDENEDPIYDVVLYIYTNGKTSSYAKKVSASSMGKYTKDGVLTRDEVEIVVEKYFKTYDDTKYYGLFDEYYWNDGNYLTKNAVSKMDLDPDETNYVYVMVKDAKAYVADSTNPKTGDNIMIAVTTMALAAVAMVSMVELKKRKMI